MNSWLHFLGWLSQNSITLNVSLCSAFFEFRKAKFPSVDFCRFVDRKLGTIENLICALDRERAYFLDRNREPAATRLLARQRVARVGAALLRRLLSPAAHGHTCWYTRPTAGLSPEALSREPRARPPRVRCLHTRARWSQSAAAPAAPKRHAVGRVARRARPDISSHFTNRPRLTLKAGRQAGLST